MIKSLKIQNFQSHENTELTFDDGVNVIVGSSDSGKTAIIRAFRWVVWNRPSGDANCSTWGGTTSVEISTGEGSVVRSKSKVDAYRVSGRGKDIDFKAFGTAVPEEVQSLINVNEINLQSQLDAPFLLSESPGAVAEHFNRVARLDTIDRATSRINGWIRELTTSIRYKEEQEEKLQEEVRQFEHLNKLEAEIEVLEEMSSNMSALWNKVQGLTKAIGIIKGIEQQIEENKELPSLEPLVDKVLKSYEQRTELYTPYAKMSGVLRGITSIEKDIKREQETLNELEPLFHKEMGDTCILCGQKIKR
jgi:exonuclease SbcC